MPLNALAVLLVSCGAPTSGRYWEGTDCSEWDESLIERGVAEATLVEAYVDEALAYRFVGDVPAYATIVDRLVEVYSASEIHCGIPSAEAERDFGGLVFNEGRSILVNVESITWQRALADWQAGQAYGALSAVEVASLVETLDDDGYWELTEGARSYLLGPALAASILIHEAAHLEVRYCCHHPHGDTERDCDFVDTIGGLAAHGVYFERWHLEGQWLGQLYYAARSE